MMCALGGGARPHSPLLAPPPMSSWNSKQGWWATQQITWVMTVLTQQNSMDEDCSNTANIMSDDCPNTAPWGWPSRGGAVLYRLFPQLGEDPPCWGPGVMWSSGRTGVAQLVVRSTPDWCVVGSSPTCGTEHFAFPPSAPHQRPWYVQPRLCDWAYKRSRSTYRKDTGIVSQWSVSS